MGRTCCGPPRKAAPHVIDPAKGSDAPTIPQQPDELAARRELRAWRRAARHLNDRGYAAAVPAALAGRLEREGLAVWPAGRRGWAA